LARDELRNSNKPDDVKSVEMAVLNEAFRLHMNERVWLREERESIVETVFRALQNCPRL
jgi:hypothetical protein